MTRNEFLELMPAIPAFKIVHRHYSMIPLLLSVSVLLPFCSAQSVSRSPAV